MANIAINDLTGLDYEILTSREADSVYGGAGLTPGEGLGLGIAIVTAGIGVAAMATPVGWLAGGFLYGFGMGMSMYSGYMVGGGGSSRFNVMLK
jgi:hypothetical protein